MRQVPHYLIIGNGRVARHFRHYFSELNISFDQWQRGDSSCKFEQATHILLLINDDAIEPFIEQHLKNSTAYLIHFSGSLITDRAHCTHPLMSFHHELYSLEHYQAIPFIIDEQAPAFEILFPNLSNPHVRLPTSLKAKYHALCVLSGNFSCLLWQKLFTAFEKDFNIPREFAFPYLQQQTNNLLTNANHALTGPLVRGDHLTIKNNLTALQDDASQALYQSFINYYQQLQASNSL